MASYTPTKSVSEKILNLCRCCNTKNARRVNLYGESSKEKGLVEAIVSLTQIEISETDNFSNWICRSCATKVETLKNNVDMFKALCKNTKKEQEKELSSARTKRCRKNSDTTTKSPTYSPVVSQSMEPKRHKISESRTSRSLAGIYGAIAPKRLLNTQSPNVRPRLQLDDPWPPSNSSQRRQLPESVSRETDIRPETVDSEEFSFLSTCGLQTLKVTVESLLFINRNDDMLFY